MPDQQQWQALYAFSVRDAIDLAKTAIADAGADGTSVSNTGMVKGEGTQHFVATSSVCTGFVNASGDTFFALALNNRPSWEPGQEYVESDKAIGEVAPTAGTGYNFLRGIVGPTGSIEVQASTRTITPFLWGLVHKGASEDKTTADDIKHTFELPSNAEPDVEAYISALRRLSITTADSQVLSDSVVTRVGFTSAEGEALVMSVDLMGRYLDNDFEADAVAGEAGSGGDQDHNAPNLNFIEENPLLHQNMDCIIQNAAAEHRVVECEGFDFTVTAEVVSKRYNNKFPIRYVIAGYTIEGSIRIPWGATDAGGNLFLEKLTDTANPNNVDVSLTEIDLLWKGTRLVLGTQYNDTTINTQARLLGLGDLRIAIGALVTGVTVEGEDESMLNVAFQGVNIRSGNVVTQPAFGIYVREDFGPGYGIP
jgi:hypothetical protein